LVEKLPTSLTKFVIERTAVIKMKRILKSRVISHVPNNPNNSRNCSHPDEFNQRAVYFFALKSWLEALENPNSDHLKFASARIKYT